MSTTKTYAPGDTARVRITRNLRGYLRTVLPVGTEAAATYAEYAPYASAQNPSGAHWRISTGANTNIAVFPHQIRIVG